MAASATPWSKATVSQAVTQPEPVRPVEAATEPPRPPDKQIGPVAELVAWIGVGVIGVLLVVLLQDVSWSGSPASAHRDTRAVQAAHPLGRLAGGIAVGSVVDNDGRTLRVRGLTGDTTTVHTDAGTSTHVFPGSKVSDIGSGSMIMVYGAEQADGSVDANLIVGLTMPG
ncbi:hypothetical protein AB0L57_25950 [Nocardia sp. NPDC052254]|uniref:hypothetical protein n=1 Tax=Nocardia sp. NPDC052254 TaxID=3155681 RepID=UPI003427D7EA